MIFVRGRDYNKTTDPLLPYKFVYPTTFVVSPPVDVSELFNCYNTTLTRLVNLHAPVVTVTSYSRPTAPWFDHNCHLAKARRLEKMFRS